MKLKPGTRSGVTLIVAAAIAIICSQTSPMPARATAVTTESGHRHTS